MAAAYVLIGTIAGMLAFTIALLFGGSFWSALMLYTGVGTSAVIAAAAWHILVDKLFGRPSVKNTCEEAQVSLHQPLSQPEPALLELPHHVPQEAMRILAVDDDPSILELIPMIAAEAGFTEITTASSGAVALDLIAKTDTVFDCFLLDISMPEMDGIDLCERIRKMMGYSQSPIIMLTAMRDTEFLGRAFKAGATDYATKPFDITELGDRLLEAHEDVIARDQGGAKIWTNDAFSTETPDLTVSELADVSGFEGVTGFVAYDALGNYLTCLSRGDLERKLVFALKVDQIETIKSRTSSEMFSGLLKKTAHAIGEVFKVGEPLTSYAGNGSFLIVSDAGIAEHLERLESEIESLLRSGRFEDSNGERLEIGVSIGNPITPDAGGKATRAGTTFGRAITSSEAREMHKDAEVVPSRIRLV